MRYTMKHITCIFLIAVMIFASVITTVNAEVISSEGIFFKDVKDGHWYTEYIRFCYNNGIVKGMTPTVYAPNGNMTRAQFLMILANHSGVDLTKYDVNVFDDVKENHWYYGAVAWAYENGIVSGTGMRTFSPNINISREQMAVMMYKYLQLLNISIEIDDSCLDRFPDSPYITWSEQGCKALVSMGLISGYPDGRIRPRYPVTRAQISVIMKIFMEEYIFNGCEHSFGPATCTKGPVCNGCGMVNGMPLGHSCQVLTCSTGSQCDRCGEYIESDPGFHEYDAATCVVPSTCKHCGGTKGTVSGHQYISATCTSPKKCTVCGYVIAPAYGHTTYNGRCTRCNIDIFPTQQHRVKHYLHKKGVLSGGYLRYGCDYISSVDGDTEFYIMMDAQTGKLYLYCYNHHVINHSTMLIDISEKVNGRYYFEHLYYNYETDLTGAGIGYIDPATGSIEITEYRGPDYMRNWYNGRTERIYGIILDDFDYYMWTLCDGRIEDFGFKDIK